MGKGAFIKRMDGYSQKLQYKHYNGKKKQTEAEEGRRRVLRIWNFQAGKLPKKLFFSGIAHSALMPLGHFELHFWLCQLQTRKTTIIFFRVYTQ